MTKEQEELFDESKFSCFKCIYSALDLNQDAYICRAKNEKITVSRDKKFEFYRTRDCELFKS